MSITGTNLHDLPRTMVGYEMYESAAKPNGIAAVMMRAHWRNLNRSSLFLLVVDPDRPLLRPNTSLMSWPFFRRSRRYMNEENALSAL